MPYIQFTSMLQLLVGGDDDADDADDDYDDDFCKSE